MCISSLHNEFQIIWAYPCCIWAHAIVEDTEYVGFNDVHISSFFKVDSSVVAFELTRAWLGLCVCVVVCCLLIAMGTHTTHMYAHITDMGAWVPMPMTGAPMLETRAPTSMTWVPMSLAWTTEHASQAWIACFQYVCVSFAEASSTIPPKGEGVYPGIEGIPPTWGYTQK